MVPLGSSVALAAPAAQLATGSSVSVPVTPQPTNRDRPGPKLAVPGTANTPAPAISAR